MGNQVTKAALDALFADNETGDITPARLRDFVESVLPSKAGMHFDDPGTVTPIAAASTPVKAANTSSSHGLNRFSHPADNRLQYDGDEDVDATVLATLSFTCAGNNKVIAFYIAINGAVVVSSKMRTKIATGADVQAITVMAHPTLSPGDYIEVWVANETDDSDVTIEHGHVHALAYLT